MRESRMHLNKRRSAPRQCTQCSNKIQDKARNKTGTGGHIEQRRGFVQSVIMEQNQYSSWEDGTCGCQPYEKMGIGGMDEKERGA